MLAKVCPSPASTICGFVVCVVVETWHVGVLHVCVI